jgi:ribosomal protein S27E
MKDWFSTDSQEFHLQKGENRLVKYTINVPSDANLGGHYGAIFFKTACQDVSDKNVVYSDKSSLCVSGRVGTLFLASIGGNGVKKGEIERVDAPRVTFSDHTGFSVAIKNTGNTHFQPEGTIDVKTFTGAEILHMDVKDKTLLPDEDYVLSGERARSDGLGIYKISGSIRDGDGNEMKFQRWVFMLPWKEISVIIVVLGVFYWFRKKFQVKKIGKT